MAQGNKQKIERELNQMLKTISDRDAFVFPAVMGTVADVVDEYIGTWRNNLERFNNNASEQLAQSISALPIDIDGKRIIVNISFNDYGLEVDRGTRPKGFTKERRNKLVPNIIKWIYSKPSLQSIASQSAKKRSLNTGHPKKLLKEVAVSSLAFAISTNILKKGTLANFGYKGSRWFSRELDSFKNELTNRMRQALGRDISINFSITK
jgi:hypothetical protein